MIMTKDVISEKEDAAEEQFSCGFCFDVPITPNQMAT